MMSYDEALAAVISAIVQTRSGATPASEVRASTVLWPNGELNSDTLGLDSLDMLEVVFTLEEDLDLVLPEDVDVAELITVGDLASFLASRAQSNGQ